MSATQTLSTADAKLVELLGACANGQSQALEQLYALASPILFGCVTRMVRRRAVAEEILQDAFVSIWQRAAQYQSTRGSPMAWMIAVARYRAIDQLRHERGAPVLMPDIPDAASEADESGQLAGPSEAMERCMRQLTGDQQRCIEFAFVNGRSHEEIARLTGNPLGTVKSWIRRALRALRECLES
jgi:RNA polymerase sigma-70 factor (ECF subfamily)